MISGRVIVCIGNSWHDDPTSKHHIMRALSSHNDIVWVNYRGTRRPRATAADFRSAKEILRRSVMGIERVAPRIHQITPFVLPGGGRFADRVNRRLLVRAIRNVAAAVDPARARPVQVWSFAPDAAFLVGALDEECFVYYCTDDYTRFEGFDLDRIRRTERRLLCLADVVFATSEELLRRKRLERADITLMRHGVDFDHFASAWRQTLPLPTDITEIPRPILGFFGLIHHWIDVTLIADVARLRPHYHFVLIGDCKSDVGVLNCCDNVYLLGRKPYSLLPAYCRAFDVALLPFVRSPMTRAVNPIKLLEYLAAGLPVVSTSLPEALRVPGPIRFGDRAIDFARACDESLFGGSAFCGDIGRCVERESWSDKVCAISDIVQRAQAARESNVTLNQSLSLARSAGVAGLAPVSITEGVTSHPC